MKKLLMLICAPVTSRSGYGDHARDLVTSFMKYDKYEIHILDVRWGDCPRNALDKNNIDDKKMLDCILKEPHMDKQPDIYVDIRIPQEFETYGKFNIGITAGIETTAVSSKWIQDCNKMDLIIVPSEHSRHGFVQSIYDKVNNTPDGQQQVVGQLKLDKPMEVLFEGVDEIYKPLNHKEIDKEFFDWLNDEVPEKFAFLFVGQWVKGGYGEDRKDIARLLKIFYETFANKRKQPALILKTSGAGFSILDNEDIKAKILEVKSQFPLEWKLPNAYLLHGDLSKEEMNYLYNHPKTKCMVSLTHGEGFGRPLLEATMTGLPVVASNWSGQLDFLNSEKCILIGGDLQPVPESQHWKDIIVPESKWFVVDESQTSKVLDYTHKNHNEFKNKSKELMEENRQKFTLDKMAEKLDKIMEKYTSHISPEFDSTEVKLNLPKLKKVNKGEIPEGPPKIKLPKLKKVTREATV